MRPRARDEAIPPSAYPHMRALAFSHFANTAGARFTECAFGENHNAPLNVGDVYVDFDDIAISSVGYIGPLGPAPFPAPRNLRIQ